MGPAYCSLTEKGEFQEEDALALWCWQISGHSNLPESWKWKDGVDPENEIATKEQVAEAIKDYLSGKVYQESVPGSGVLFKSFINALRKVERWLDQKMPCDFHDFEQEQE